MSDCIPHTRSGYSAEVSLSFKVGALSYRLSHCGAEGFIVHKWEKKPLPEGPLSGMLVFTLDGDETRTPVSLPQGLQKSGEWTPYVCDEEKFAERSAGVGE